MYPSSLPNIDLQVLPTFPAHVQGSGPITVSKSGLTYTFGADFRQIMHTTALTPVADYHALLQNVETGSFHRASLADIYANFDPPNGSIGNGKLADMPEATVKGRPAGSGTGAPQDITVSQALDSIGDDVGTLAVRGAAGWEALAPGDQWKVLASMGAGAVPQWVDNTPANNTVTDAKVYTPANTNDPNAVKATKIAFLQGGTGAVERFVQDKMRDVVSVLDFIPASLHSGIRNGTNTTNLESYIQSAIDSVSAGGSLYFPAGTYQVAAALSVVTNHVRIYGASRRGTKIVQQVASAKVFNVTGSYFSLESLSIEYASQGTSGGTAVDISGAFYSTIDDVYIYRPHVGVKYSSSANSHTGARILVVDATQNGVLVDGAVHVLWDKFQILNSNTTTLCTLGCILLAGAVEGCDFINGQTYQGVQSLVTTAPSFAFGQMPSYNKFHAVYFDAATAAVIDKATELDFVDCWFSNRPEHGVYVAQVDGVRFTGGGAINCGKHGVLVESVARRVFFDGFAARSNSVTAANTYSGLYFAAGTVDFGATGCVCTNDLLAFGNQKYGIEIQPGACDRYTLSNNIVVGNATGGIFDGGTGTEKYIHHNVGYRTSARGSAVVPTGNTSATVSHGLDVTPAQADFISVPTVNLGDVGVSRWWIDNVTATTFRLNVDAPTTADAFFAWDVRAKGA
jgi:hypothetical protein